jgi:hypothetical protein
MADTRTPAPADPPKAYEVLVGLNYPPDNKRAEPGDVVSDLPTESISWLLAQGVIALQEA